MNNHWYDKKVHLLPSIKEGNNVSSEYETLILTRKDVELITTVQIKMWPHLWPSILGKYNSFLSNSITEY